RAVARRAHAFGMKIIFTTRSSDPGDDRFTRVDFESLLRESDIVSIHCPLTDETTRLFDPHALESMKPGSFLINTARGSVVDEEALVESLETGHLAGAGLDVFEDEPHAHPGLRDRTDVVLLPHIGSATVETRTAMARLAASNVAAVLRGDRPPHPVNELVR
ncbi:MAG: NAD(P)-dependent oxidoreductase, partial [Thermoanaerobaculia bacterium]|nr:NAD(P)-dependent oxidoreductase [Thermoanaerobaculia bacterium]